MSRIIPAFAAIALVICSDTLNGQVDPLPKEPIEIGWSPQFVFDGFVVDNHWAIRYKREAVRRVFHPPTKHAQNPLILGDGGYVSVARDESTDEFRMWYQTWTPSAIPGKSGQYAIAYAESKDGLKWTRPNLGLMEWKGDKDNNIVWKGLTSQRGSQAFFLDAPKSQMKGYRYVMLYGGRGGSHLIGSNDGVHWDRTSDTTLTKMHSDTHNSIVYDPRRGEYVMFCRAKHIYRTFRGDVLDTGASRRIARMSSKELWTTWNTEPQTILIPDERDAESGFGFFYGMPTRYHAGIYWGFLWPFKMNTDIHTELAWSRDGFQFHRLPSRPKLIARGADGEWDDGMVFGGYQWIEMGDQWWMYYAGWDGPHGVKERTPGIGLITLRKEGFLSLRGPTGGGVVCTRKIQWPGGDLAVNADASGGRLKVRVSDARRKPLPGFDYGDIEEFQGDSVDHLIRWKQRSMAELAGQTIRLEFFLQDADLYTFRAHPSTASDN